MNTVLERVVSAARSSISTVAKASIYKIHPAIGVARVGNAPPDDFFIGPEIPRLSASPPGGNFKSGGKVRKQAARFRIFEYKYDTTKKKYVPVEVTIQSPQIQSIVWTVHVANRKAAYYKFNGRQGFPVPPNPGRPLRNKAVTDGALREANLVIDTAAQTITASAGGGGGGAGASSTATFTNQNGTIPIPTLGEMRLDAKGRLLVLGGDGKSASSTGAKIKNYSNNNTWFDDVSDGPVTAKITLKASGRVIDVIGAWVIVGPPDFAPPIGNVISTYDRLYDVAIQSSLPAFAVPPDNAIYDGPRLKRYRDRKSQGAGAYKPSYTEEIYPLLKATVDLQWVNSSANGSHPTSAFDFTALSKTDPASKPKRQHIFSRLRLPDGSGDDMPKLLGDEGENPGDPNEHLPITKTQAEFMRNWANGQFIADWTGSPPPDPTAQEEGIPPEDLDRAALENCCGGAFYPGIECGWLIQNENLYFEPFRIKHATLLGIDAGMTYQVGPGFFTQQMALPWQADFYDCRSETHNDGDWAWWPGQRPDDVFTPASPTTLVPWARGLIHSDDNKSMLDMVNNWFTRGFVVKIGPDKYQELEGPP